MNYLLMQLLSKTSLVFMGGRECHSPLTAMYSYSFPSKSTSQLLIIIIIIFSPPFDLVFVYFVSVCSLLLKHQCVKYAQCVYSHFYGVYAGVIQVQGWGIWRCTSIDFQPQSPLTMH